MDPGSGSSGGIVPGVWLPLDDERSQWRVVISPGGEHGEVGLAGDGEAEVVMAREDREVSDVAAPSIHPGSEHDLLWTVACPREPERSEFGGADFDSEDDLAFVTCRVAGHEKVEWLAGFGPGGPFDFKPVGVRCEVGTAGFGKTWKVVRRSGRRRGGGT
jgi:hypothetical protein